MNASGPIHGQAGRPAINVVQVWNNAHKPIFDDLIDSIVAGFADLGIRVSRTENGADPECINIVIGATIWVAKHLIGKLQGIRFVVYQMEPLANDRGFLPQRPDYLALLREANGIWDYSRSNINALAGMGLSNAIWVRPGYHPILERVPPSPEKPIDVLFCGALSERRARVLAQLEQAGLRVEAHAGLYGEARNRLIGQSRVILNIHQHDTLGILEEVRLSFLLANGCFVVSEQSDWNPYGNGIVYAAYDHIAETCVKFARCPDVVRNFFAQAGKTSIIETPMSAELERTLPVLRALHG